MYFLKELSKSWVTTGASFNVALPIVRLFAAKADLLPASDLVFYFSHGGSEWLNYYCKPIYMSNDNQDRHIQG